VENKNKEVIIIISLNIDQAKNISGYSVLNDLQLVDRGLINLKGIDNRMPIYTQTIIKLISQHEPDVICFEDLKTNQNPDTIRDLAEMTGIIKLIAESQKIPWRKYIPVSIRAKLCTKKTGAGGRGTKTDLAERICELYNIEFPYDEIFGTYTKGKNKGKPKINFDHEFLNQTDAIGIGLYHYHYGDQELYEKLKRDIQQNWADLARVDY
jgi:Holliday junction resolvasome RuvABC endonuclease subunit